MGAEKKKVADEPVRFSKEQLLGATVFADKIDVLEAVVKNGEKLAKEEAQTRIVEFMSGTCGR